MPRHSSRSPLDLFQVALPICACPSLDARLLFLCSRILCLYSTSSSGTSDPQWCWALCICKDRSYSAHATSYSDTLVSLSRQMASSAIQLIFRNAYRSAVHRRSHLRTASNVVWQPQRTYAYQSPRPQNADPDPNPVSDDAPGESEKRNWDWRATGFKMFESAATTAASITILG